MERYVIRASLDEVIRDSLWSFDHQMNIEGHFGEFSNVTHHFRPKREVRDETPVHNVEMQPVRSRILNQFHRIGNVGEIGREYRYCDDR